MARRTKRQIDSQSLEVIKLQHPQLIDLDKAKDQILTELYTSAEFKTKMKNIIAKRDMGAYNNYYQDIVNDVMLQMYKKDSEYIFLKYCKNPSSLIAIALTICHRMFKPNLHCKAPKKGTIQSYNHTGLLSSHSINYTVNPTDKEESREDNEPSKSISLLDISPVDDRVETQKLLEAVYKMLSPQYKKKYNQLMKLLQTRNIEQYTVQQFLAQNPNLIQKIKEKLALIIKED